MKVLICYDVKNNRLRSKLVKYLEKIAVRIQYSVFVSDLNRKELEKLTAFAKSLLSDEGEKSFLIFNAASYGDNTAFNLLPQQCIIL